MRRRLLVYVACAATAVTTLAACGSSSKIGSGSGTSATGRSGTSGSQTSAAAPTGGTAANPKLSPVKVGFDNLESASFSLADVRIGFEQGMKYVNEQLGGINGHPLQAVECKTDLTAASSVNCANTFVQDHVVADFEGVTESADSGLPILKAHHIPIIGITGLTPAEEAAKGVAFNYLSSSYEFLVAGLATLQKLGAKNIVIALATGGVNNQQTVNKIYIPDAKKLGVKVSFVYFSQSLTDWTSEVASILVKHPDAVDFPGVIDAECSGFVPAFRAAGFTGPLFAGSCSTFANNLPGGTVNGVLTYMDMYLPGTQNVPTSVQSDLAIYEKYMGKQSTLAPNKYATAYLGFAEAVIGSDMLRQVPGSLTASTVLAGLPKTHGREFLNTTTYNCDGSTSWPGSSSCTTGVIVAHFNDNKQEVPEPFSPVNINGLQVPGLP